MVLFGALVRSDGSMHASSEDEHNADCGYLNNRPVNSCSEHESTTVPEVGTLPLAGNGKPKGTLVENDGFTRVGSELNRTQPFAPSRRLSAVQF
jgi:hypothetical protein